MKQFIWCTFICFCTVTVKGESYEDSRCKCLCTIINGSRVERKLFHFVVPAENDCDYVPLPPEIERSQNKTEELCPKCQCTYETRNTTIIKVAVIIVLWIISLLLVYMLFLLILDPILNLRLRGSYVEHTNEEDESPSHANSINIPGGVMGMTIHSSGMISSESRNVLNRVGHQQNKWKEQVKEQRKNIYDRHTMLN